MRMLWMSLGADVNTRDKYGDMPLILVIIDRCTHSPRVNPKSESRSLALVFLTNVCVVLGL